MSFDAIIFRIAAAATLAAALLTTPTRAAAPADPHDTVSFNRDIRPLLADRCFACHGPDKKNRKAKLRLDIPDGPEGAYHEHDGAAAITPGSIERSTIWQRLVTDDKDEMMPPPETTKKRLTAAELQKVRRWIESGARYDAFWAFEPPRMPDKPTVKDTAWSEQMIDLLVLRKLEDAGLKPSPEADKRTLIRRVTFDLTGLPPTRDEVRAFVNDDSATAYEALVDRLLASPRYGEHMARYWLDLVRFADTNGMHKDFYRNHVAYREWVIRAFNDNLGYDDFLKYQLAGDLYPEPTEEQLVASDFNRLHLIIDRGTALPEESFAKNVFDRVTAVGTAFMGMTLHCSMCHDHKYDPLTMRDFYSLSAFFNNIDAAPETAGGTKDGLQPPTIQLDKSKWSAPASMVMKERAEVRQTFILNRGEYDKPGDPVERNTPAFLFPLEKKGDVATRMDLADWFVDPRQPLTARVAVNRFWQQVFGVGLVKTAEDLGAQGEVPSHPELLDFLAVSFIESGWDIKALMRQIVLSRTYRQSSKATPPAFERDPENRLLARGSRYRLDAEMIRDQILATSGLLVEQLYGPSVKPPQPAGLWEAVTMIGERYKADAGDAIHRRSVYTFWKRAMPPPQMTILNAPIRDACIARRERTNTPAQALLLLNEEQYMKAARSLAQHALAQDALTDAQRIDYAYEVVTCRLPGDHDSAVLTQLLDDLRSQYRDNAPLAAKLCEGVQLADDNARAELAAWTIIVNTLYNLDMTKNRE